jgi:hypothetical protein
MLEAVEDSDDDHIVSWLSDCKVRTRCSEGVGKKFLYLHESYNAIRPLVVFSGMVV